MRTNKPVKNVGFRLFMTASPADEGFLANVILSRLKIKIKVKVVVKMKIKN